jgi:hypothetical protein
VKSLFAGTAALVFAYNAFFFIASPFAYDNSGALGGIDGDPGAVAVTWAVRAICVGLALLSLAFVDWRGVGHALRAIGPPAEDSAERSGEPDSAAGR